MWRCVGALLPDPVALGDEAREEGLVLVEGELGVFLRGDDDVVAAARVEREGVACGAEGFAEVSFESSTADRAADTSADGEAEAVVGE